VIFNLLTLCCRRLEFCSSAMAERLRKWLAVTPW